MADVSPENRDELVDLSSPEAGILFAPRWVVAEVAGKVPEPGTLFGLPLIVTAIRNRGT